MCTVAHLPVGSWPEVHMDGWKALRTLPSSEQTKLRWYLRQASDNGIVESGVACKFGREWHINMPRLAGWLIERTQLALRPTGHAIPAKTNKSHPRVGRAA